VVVEIGVIVNDPEVVQRGQRETNRMVWRYLRWHMIRDEGKQENVAVGEWRARAGPV
jgi:hypothetical protein